MKRQQAKVTTSKGRRGYQGEWTEDGQFLRIGDKLYGIEIGPFVNSIAEGKHVVKKVEEEKIDEDTTS